MQEDNIICFVAQKSWQKNSEDIKMKKSANPHLMFTNPADSSNNHKGKGTYIIVDEQWCSAIYLHKIFKKRYSQGVIFSTFDKVNWIVINIYIPSDSPPNQSDPEFVADFLYPINQWIKIISHENSQIIIAGDFNRVLHPEMDRSDNSEHPKDKIFRDLITSFQWINVFCLCNPWTRQYTRKLGGHNHESKINYLFSTDNNWTSASIIETSKYKSAHRIIKSTTTAQTKFWTTKPPSLCRWILSLDNSNIMRRFLNNTEIIEPTLSPTELVNHITNTANSSLHIIKPKPRKLISSDITTSAIEKEIKFLSLAQNSQLTQMQIYQSKLDLLHHQLSTHCHKLISNFFNDQTLLTKKNKSLKQLYRLCN